jgi:hypothetical protein
MPGWLYTRVVTGKTRSRMAGGSGREKESRPFRDLPPLVYTVLIYRIARVLAAGKGDIFQAVIVAVCVLQGADARAGIAALVHLHTLYRYACCRIHTPGNAAGNREADHEQHETGKRRFLRSCPCHSMEPFLRIIFSHDRKSRYKNPGNLTTILTLRYKFLVFRERS